MSVTPEEAPPRTAGEMVSRARAFLQRRGVEEWRLEAELLVAHALGLDRLRLFLALDRPVTSDEIERARALLVRRGKREPTAYIVGEREFYGRAFHVGPGVLVPRPETELVVDRAREIAAREPIVRVFDWGTGSGCLAITLAHEIAGSRVEAVDASPDALDYARRNLERHSKRIERSTAPLGASRTSEGAASSTSDGMRAVTASPAAIDVRLHLGDGFALLAELARRDGPFDLVVANPPYVARSESASLAPEVRDHEPHAALFAPGDDRDALLARFVDEASRALAPRGTLLVELGHDQAPSARRLCAARGIEPRFLRDFAGIERVLEVRAAS